MKTRFTTLDICAVLTEINSKLVGMRLANVYDINNKTYLLKLAKPDMKAMLLMESGIRLHISEFDWPKNMMPSGFSMKMRKHLKGRRLVSAKQLGIDRIVDLQFGSDEAAFHIILELYDRGNIVLTDHQYTILNILRYRKDGAASGIKTEGGKDANVDDNADVRFAVHETYPLHAARKRQEFDDVKKNMEEVVKSARKDDALKRVLNPHLPYGAPTIEHCLLNAGFTVGEKVDSLFDVKRLEQLFLGLRKGEELLNSLLSDSLGGYIVQKEEKKSDGTFVLTNIEFHPYLFKQHEKSPHVKYDSFNKTVDEFFGSLESQKADMKILQQEKSAHKKLENIRKDHEQRLSNLEKEQATDKYKAQLIEENLALVEQAIHVIRTAIANQIDWDEISSLIKDAQDSGDPVALSIAKLNLKSNEFTIALHEAGYNSDSDDESSSNDETESTKVVKRKKPRPIKVNIDLSLSAYGNAKKYYTKKRQASNKQQKIIDASEKALKSAEKKTTQTLKEAATIHNIQKARKIFWFEKFIWFISSENYLVIGGRDAQQNEILVKKYLTGGDLYVHADLHGATSCIIKNPKKEEVPPKTLNEAGTMAICHSAAWSAKVVTSAWWVSSQQVSKTAPSGEYLTTGSFLIRGKKNYLPPSYLVYGFGILFKVDETCIHKHQDERKVIALDAVSEVDSASVTTEESLSIDLENDLEIWDGEDSDQEQDSRPTQSLEPDDLDLGNVVVENPSFNKDVDSEGPLASQETVDKDDADVEESVQSLDEDKVVTPDFPETNVKMKYESFQGVQEDVKEELAEEDNEGESQEENGTHVVYLGDDQPVQLGNHSSAPNSRKSAKQKRLAKKAARTESENSETPPTNLGNEKRDKCLMENTAPQPKRGQRNKLKKMKNKYKDQDEEEREMKMELLQQSQSQKARDRKAKKNKAAAKQAHQGNNQGKGEGKRPKNQPKPQTKPAEDDSDEERSKVLQNEHLSEESAGILNSLTGCPVPDDILLFAIPVCAPYNTMNNYKFKVKLTPGNTKKGKGAKTALNLFQNMRETTSQEKDHLRSIKDHDLARNIPGKVKVSSTNLQLQRKKR